MQTDQDDGRTTSIGEHKRRIRRAMLAVRQGLSETQQLAWSPMVWQRLTHLSCYQRARVILAYMACDREVLTDGLLRQAMASQKQVVLPVVQVEQRHLTLYAIQDLEHDVMPGFRGILEPQPTRTHRVALEALEMAIVPGVAFDLEGGRLGFGAGFYDRLLSQLHHGIPKVGIAFEFQVVPRLPREPHDVTLDAIVTESRVIWSTPFSAEDAATVARFTNNDGGRGEV